MEKVSKIYWEETGLLDGLEKKQKLFVIKILNGVSKKLGPKNPLSHDFNIGIRALCPDKIFFPITRRVAIEVLEKAENLSSLLTADFIVNEVFKIYPLIIGLYYNYYANTKIDMEAYAEATTTQMIVNKFIYFKFHERPQNSQPLKKNKKTKR